MEQDNASFGHILKILHHVVKVQIRACGVVVAILVHFQARVVKDRMVVTPGRVWNVNILMPVSVHELSKHTKASSSRQRLDTVHSVLLHRSRVLAVHEFDGQVHKLAVTRL
jgi:hypothetical protein